MVLSSYGDTAQNLVSVEAHGLLDNAANSWSAVINFLQACRTSLECVRALVYCLWHTIGGAKMRSISDMACFPDMITLPTVFAHL
ncbi:hypothetical protein Tco_0090803 [Tanacetum coccineum]